MPGNAGSKLLIILMQLRYTYVITFMSYLDLCLTCLSIQNFPRLSFLVYTYNEISQWLGQVNIILFYRVEFHG